MVGFRCYLLDHNGHIRSAQQIEAIDDAEALMKAAADIQPEHRAHGVEVWQGSRIVGRIPAIEAEADAEELTVPPTAA